MQMYRFLQPPPDVTLTTDSYIDTRSVWDPNLYLSCTYCFLSNDEAKLFASNEQKYLITQINEYSFLNVTGANKVELPSTGMVKDYLFYLSRSDANLRNDWSNFTNWAFSMNPLPLLQGTNINQNTFCFTDPSTNQLVCIQPNVNPDGSPTGLSITNTYNVSLEKNILIQFGVLFDGEYREDLHPANIYNYVEKYSRSSGDGKDGLYCYDFCLMTNTADLQPSGAINMSRFNKIEFEFTTIVPPLDPLAQSIVICDPDTGNVIGINKPTWRIYKYNYDMTVFEEKINMIVFVGGNAALLYAN
jgi:hypothetical protein